MKIHIIPGNENWVVDRLVDEFYQHNVDITTKEIENCDIIWLLAPWRWSSIHLHYLVNKNSFNYNTKIEHFNSS